jgi:hypothetical protein
LYGPDALIVAGPWLAEHPRDLAALEGMARASVAESEALCQTLAAASPVVGRWRARPSTPSRDPAVELAGRQERTVMAPDRSGT